MAKKYLQARFFTVQVVRKGVVLWFFNYCHKGQRHEKTLRLRAFVAAFYQNDISLGEGTLFATKAQRH
jgi:hypothetical protein